ncbi:neural cell adhesion molecule 1 [Bicyclus anynana]|uniref:Neural cell adhesion molecule 1 n=1 Tax=Bicyclus anynana TaxID=110368 RepID=A0A6J1MRF9_BICAN|nr:neural cell adhesion molecule 1 [Bicyclus anynana]
MKWIFYVIVFIYMFYRTVYGKVQPTLHKEPRSTISIDPIDYGQNGNYFETGKRITIACKGASKNQKVEWVNPEGEVVQRNIQNRVYAQEHFVASYKTRLPALLLTISLATVEDTGVWECRAGDTTREVSLCVIDPSSFVNTPSEVAVDHGRSITLSCQARGEPEPRLLWYRNGEIITDDPSSSKYELMTQYHSQGFAGLLTITSVESEDNGDYFCEAIQESPRDEECSARIKMNITLHVSSPPTFAGGNETTMVPAEENKSVDLVCAANAYPIPTYRWFKEVGNILSEYPQDDILLQDNGAEAVITVTANASTFGHRFQCRASNEYGEMDKVFTLIHLEKPPKPDKISVSAADHETIKFYAHWKQIESPFPVDNMIVQYFKKELLGKRSILREIDWKRGKETVIKTDENGLINEEQPGIYFTLSGLEEEQDYVVRMRALNEAGTSSWYGAIHASTLEKTEETEELPIEEESEEDKPQYTAAALSDGTFYGVFFAGGIIVIVVGCMFIMRMV